MDRSCPRSPAKAVLICENTPETSDKASRSMHSRETDRVECRCFPGAGTKPYPMCKTQALRFEDSPLRVYCQRVVFSVMMFCRSTSLFSAVGADQYVRIGPHASPR